MNHFVELKDVLMMIVKNLRLVIMTVIIFGLIGAGLSYLVPPVYEARSDLLVSSSSPDNQEISSSEIDTNLRLIETYKYILQSTSVLDLVAAQAGGSENSEELSKKITIETKPDSQIISIVAQDSDPSRAAILVNSTARIFQQQIQTLMKIDNIQILTLAKIDGKMAPIKPSHVIYTVLAVLLGGITSFFILLIKETVFAKTDSTERTEKAFQLSALGMIPEITENTKGRIRDITNSCNYRYLRTLAKMEKGSPVIESYRALRTNLHYTINQNKLKTILVTSSNPEEGKSLTAGNLAICMAMDNKKTVYVDSDLRKGVGEFLFNKPARKGLTNYLEGYADADEIIHATEVPGLSFISKGPNLNNPVELLTSDKMSQLLEELKEKFDVIIIDCPPLIVTDAVALSDKVDGCLFVVNAKKTKQDQALKSIQQLRKVQANILGLIINCGKVHHTSYSNYY